MTAPPPSDGNSRSRVFDRLSKATPAVAGRERSWGFLAGLGGVGVLGVIVFTSLTHGHTAHAQASSTPPQPPPSTSLGGMPPGTPAPAPQPAAPTQPPVTLPPSIPTGNAQPDPNTQWRSPAMVVDLSQPAMPAADQAGSGIGAATPALGAVNKAPPDPKGSNQQFADRVAASQVDTAYATRLKDTALIAPQGTLISAVLETGINSDLPGFVRAVVASDVHGFDGTTVIIPRGSRLIGEYHSGVALGQSRAFVVWSRVLTPDGVSISLGSPATDPLGRAGLEGETNSHFLQRFGAAILLSVITIGGEAAVNSLSHGDTAIVIASPQAATSVANTALQKQIDIPVTIKVPQGAPVRVFVARDLDFSGVMHHRS